MRPKALLTLAFVFLSGIVLAQESVTVSFGSPGDREAFVVAGLPSREPVDSVKTKRDSVDVPTAKHKPNDAIFIWDHVSGNLASKTIHDAEKGWTLDQKDFLDIAEVKVRVESAGKPVAAASIELDDTRRKTTQLLSPSSNGEAVFFAVKPGSLKVTVKYKDTEPITQIVPASLTRNEAVPTVTIALPGKVDTVDGSTAKPAPGKSSAGDASSPSTKPAPSESNKPGADKPSAEAPNPGKSTESPASNGGGNPLGSILVFIIGLGVAGALIWFGIEYMKKNSNAVTAKLEELGAQIPKPGSDPGPDPDPIPFKPAAPQPVQKIVLDDAAPAPLANVAAPAPSSPSGGPARLVTDSGDSIEIPDGENSVGREIGLWLSLASESTVSRNHAAIVRNGTHVSVRDNGSTNGTFVNGQPVTGERMLSHGDTVQFGAVRFKYEA